MRYADETIRTTVDPVGAAIGLWLLVRTHGFGGLVHNLGALVLLVAFA